MATRERNKRACALCCVTSAILPQGCCPDTGWNHSKSNIYRRERVTVIGWITLLFLTFVFVWRNKGSTVCTDQRYQRERQRGADQTKMWVEPWRDCHTFIIIIHRTKADVVCCCVTLYLDVSLPLKPWSKVCPKMMQPTDPLLTSGSRKHRSGSKLLTYTHITYPARTWPSSPICQLYTNISREMGIMFL